ncbi:hypothetical protein DPMN_121843 [Dreissena polymorpha]|uniref:Uncharacterized protein n=1 Tax=Dreissena polymorpha TaxID=45954 RepID=A0A9D4JRF2_DREPO|nr:hypothetical protein DPMN_121843 [Dreissena polymorpha]
MIHENCEEFALNLCNWSLRHPAMRTNNLKIKEQQIFILHKQEEYTKMQEVVSRQCFYAPEGGHIVIGPSVRPSVTLCV